MKNQPHYVVKSPHTLALRVFALLLLTLLLAGASGCKLQKKQAQELVKAGSATSEQLAKYYDTLKQQRADHMSLEIFRLKRADTELDEQTKKDYQEQLEALTARAQMARKMKAVYDALGKLVDYDAPSEVTGAVVDLKKAIEDVSKKKIPKFAGIDPETALKKATNALVEWLQTRQFRKNATKAQVVLDGIIQLYEGEKSIYVQISQDYYDLAHKTAKFLHQRKQLSGTSFFQKYAEVFGLQVLPELPQSTDDATRRYTAAMEAFINNRLDAKLEELNKASEKEANERLEALKKLKKMHDDFMHGRKPKEDETEKTSRYERRSFEETKVKFAA